MKFCIINADDFGAGAGINEGIVEAHRTGVVTSASLMVNMPAAPEAVDLASALPKLSLGLHVDLKKVDASAASPGNIAIARDEIVAQWDRFVALTGRPPTHVDAHHNLHRDPLLAPLFLQLAREKDVPLREYSEVRYFSNFYAQWGGETHLEQVSVDSLLSILEREVRDGFTELACHPGRMSKDFSSGYDAEREHELATLCDSRVARRLVSLGIHLINYRDFAALQKAGRTGVQ